MEQIGFHHANESLALLLHTMSRLAQYPDSSPGTGCEWQGHMQSTARLLQVSKPHLEGNVDGS